MAIALLSRSARALGLAWILACAGAPSFARADSSPQPSPAALVAEMRHAFTLRGKPTPPEIFRDFGDGDLADSVGSIWVTVDVAAAIGSNLYADEIRQARGSVTQTKPAVGTTNDKEETSYYFVGATDNGLLVVVASYSGGGSGVFDMLHILDVAATPAFDGDGKVYQRINLTNLRSVPLGDRWQGEVKIAKNKVLITTIQRGPVDQGPTPPSTIDARRP